jgi:hypothetical protein
VFEWHPLRRQGWLDRLEKIAAERERMQEKACPSITYLNIWLARIFVDTLCP